MKYSLFKKSTGMLAIPLLVQLLLSSTVNAYPHPGGLHSQSQINQVKTKVQANIGPWKPAYDVLIAKADWLNNEKPSASADFYVPGYYSNPDGHVRASASLQDDVKAAYVSAVAYALTGIASYGNKTIEILNDWAYTNTHLGGDDSTLVMAYAGVGFIQAAELVDDLGSWNPADKSQFKSWVSNVFLDQGANIDKDRTNNWGAWGVYGAISGYRYLDDSVHVREEINRIKAKIDSQIGLNGAISEETGRGAGGLRYTYFYLSPLTAAAQVALEAEGVDLFHWTSPRGKTIKKALDYLLYYTQHPSQWPYYNKPAVPTGTEAWPYNLFEAMSDIYPDPAYAAFASARRPLMETGHNYAWSFPTLMKSDHILVDDTFDETGSAALPASWLFTNSANTRAGVTALPSAADKSLKITDNNPQGASLIRKSFPAQSGTVSAQWSFMEQSSLFSMKFGLKSGNNFAAELYTIGSNLVYKDSLNRYINIQSLKTNTWYTVTLTANPEAGTFSLSINGFLKAYGLPFTNQVSSIDSIGFYSGSAQKGAIFINNVGVRKE
ncbi:alginate lyase family protein [Paenibacillus solisilvae]|uniref:Alginate lyase family protein n=1 Tax=Paenibacillus solisilvae TaxID=2486751 RepID=A0ABW0W4T7_9BACL